jgi:hypothetical protein
MNIQTLLHGIAAACIAATISLCVPGEPSFANGPSWIANGASACERFLTPDVVVAIIGGAAGPTARLDANSCHSGSIYITLRVEDVDSFKLKLPQIVGVHMMSGVGDLAYWNQAGAISAVKGHDRGCDIGVIGGATKLHDEVLGKKLGEICNKLFALN